MSDLADALVMVYPNAGLPNELGEYDELPETTAGAMAFLSEAILPGLIGKSFAHPNALDRAFAPWRANRPAASPRSR